MAATEQYNRYLIVKFKKKKFCENKILMTNNFLLKTSMDKPQNAIINCSFAAHLTTPLTAIQNLDYYKAKVIKKTKLIKKDFS